MNNGDIFRWSYNKEWLKRKNDGDNGGTTYWAVSRIAIVDGDYLIDTWGSSMNTSFTKKTADERLALVFVANKSDLIEARKTDRAYYLDEDCVDLSHPNAWGENFYIRKGAVKNVNKMKVVINRYRKSIASSIQFKLRTIQQLEEQLKSVTVDSHINTNDISLNDTGWEDYEAEVIIPSIKENK